MRRNILASVGTTVATVGVGLLSVPLIIAGVGLAGFGVWTLARAVMTYVSSAQLGLGPGVQRFVAVAHGEERPETTARVLWTALALYGTLGVVAVVASQLAAPAFVPLFHVPVMLEQDAESLFRLVGVAMLLNLQAAALISVQQGLERFGASAVASVVSSAAFIAAIALLAGPQGLTGVGYAAIIQQALLVVVAAFTLRQVIFHARPRLLPRKQTRELVGFSFKLQLAGFSTLINTQADRLIVGLIAPARTVGQLGIGAQIAEAARIVGGGAIAPLVSRMSVVRGRHGERNLLEAHRRINVVWLVAVAGVAAIGAASMYPLIAAWLGPGYSQAALFGAILLLAYGFYLATGPATAYFRAVGQAEVEARYGLLVMAINAGLTVALGLALGPVGVVVGTLGAYAAGSVWFFRRAARATSDRGMPAPKRIAVATALMALASAFSLGWGLLMIALLPSPLSLVPATLGAGTGVLLFLVWAMRPLRSLPRSPDQGEPELPRSVG